MTYERAGGLIAQLEGEIAALLSRAEAADMAGEEDPQALPKEIARRAALRDKLDAARRHLEAQAEARAAAERAADKEFGKALERKLLIYLRAAEQKIIAGRISDHNFVWLTHEDFPVEAF